MQHATVRQNSGAERRKSTRSPVFWPGRLVVDDEVFDGVILDVSADGARLRLEDPPDRATLVTLQNPRFGALHGKVAWRGEDALGLSFLDEPHRVARAIEEIPPQYRMAW